MSMTCCGASAPVQRAAGAKAVFTDICADTYNLDPGGIEAALTPATRAMILVFAGVVLSLLMAGCASAPVDDTAELDISATVSVAAVNDAPTLQALPDTSLQEDTSLDRAIDLVLHAISGALVGILGFRLWQGGGSGWLEGTVPEVEALERAEAGELAFGTVDSWLIWKLTGGAKHVTDFTNASRTLLFNIRDKRWDPELCGMLGVPESMLPEVLLSIDSFGTVKGLPGIEGVPILGAAGDQQAALFGQACFDPGMAKNTYGTGCFLLMNTGQDLVHSQKGLLTTLAVDGGGAPCYALEGSVFIGGAALQWLRDEIGILAASRASENQVAAPPFAR